MKKKYYQIICGLVSLILLSGISSCTKDLGNYSYTEINELVEVANLPNELTASYGKHMFFEPEIIFSKDSPFDESKYNYEWSYIGSTAVGGARLYVLSTGKNLDLILNNMIAGTYNAFFSVQDKESGVKYRKKFVLKVVNEYNEGWLMMNEVAGKARLDMLSLNSSGSYDLVLDLLDQTGSGLTLSGQPVTIYNYNTGLLIGPDKISHGLYLSTSEGTTKIDPNTFKWTPTMRLDAEMFGDIPNGFYADAIQLRGNFSAYMIGNGNAYLYNRTLNTYYSAPISYISDEQKSFEVAPFLTGNSGIFYDKTNLRFVKHNGSGSTCSVLPEPTENQKLFSFKTGKELAYMRKVAFNGTEIFAVLKDPQSQKKYLARFNPTNNVQSYYAEMTGTDIDKAELYAISPEFGYIFYSVGGKVYEYDMVYRVSKLMADYGGRKVSYLNFYEFLNPNKYTAGNKLMVGFYDPAKTDGTEGSLDIYKVPNINADLILEASYTGFGRIKALSYRER